jgi:hypothetical protein
MVAAQLFSRSFQVEKCNLDLLHFNGYSLSPHMQASAMAQFEFCSDKR